MKWFYNMKIGMKLILGFVIVAMIAGVVGIVGIINILSTDKNYTDLYQNFGVAVGDMGEISTNYQRTRVNLRDILLEKGSKDRNKYVDKIHELNKQIDEEMIRVEKSMQTEEGKIEFAKLKSALAKFEPMQEEIIKLALAGQEEQGLAFMRGDAYAVAMEINDSIDKLFKLKVDGGNIRSGEYTVATNNTVKIMIIVVVFAMVVAIVLGIYISRIISIPVRNLAEAADKIADGDLNVSIDVDTKDEIGNLADSFRKMSDNINEVMTNISMASEQVASGSKQVSDSSIALSQGATEQASSIEELTASIEEIASQTRQNAESANEANDLAEKAKSNAAQGNEQMQEMLKAMDDINDASANISKIIKVIDEIAFQTNILALNAAVEAARAGQHGKGFAVVAEEVRNLAARSANAAKETTGMIEGTIKKVEGGTKIANDTANALNMIVEGVAKVANIVSNIAIASNEQATGIAQINQGIMQVSQVVQTNSATSEESAAASEELSSQAELLREQVSRFKLKRNTYSAFKGLENMNPEVLRMLENMSEKKTAGFGKTHEVYQEVSAASPKKISLSDKDFGKY
ncbi:MAG: methyl-accepting chemotaxis protein [Clostridia bacterium]|nr:methyl-accepting chemotaxis protein [Clostridia bacterium]